MAKQDDPDQRGKRFLGKVFERMTPPVARPPVARDEPKADDRDRDRDEDDEDAKRRRSVAAAAPVPTAFYTANKLVHDRQPAPEASAAFGRVNDSERGKIERSVESRFKTEEGRNAARAAHDDALALREQNLEKLDKTLEKVFRGIERMTADRRPVPPEAALHVNQQLIDAYAAFRRERDEIKQELAQALDEIEVEEHDLAVKAFWQPDQTPLLGYTPDLTQHFNRAVTPPPDLTEHFNRAVVPSPPDLTDQFNRAVVPPPDIMEDFERAAYDHHGWLDLMNQVEESPKPSGPEQGIDP